MCAKWKQKEKKTVIDRRGFLQEDDEITGKDQASINVKCNAQFTSQTMIICNNYYGNCEWVNNGNNWTFACFFKWKFYWMIFWWIMDHPIEPNGRPYLQHCTSTIRRFVMCIYKMHSNSWNEMKWEAKNSTAVHTAMRLICWKDSLNALSNWHRLLAQPRVRNKTPSTNSRFGHFGILCYVHYP